MPRFPCRHAHADRDLALAGRCDGARPDRSPRLALPAERGGDSLRGRGSRHAGARGAAVRARRQRVCLPSRGRPARRGGTRQPARRRRAQVRGVSAPSWSTRTTKSGLRVAAAMDHEVDGPEGATSESESIDDIARLTVTCQLASGERLRVAKYLAYGWSAARSHPAIHDQVLGALVGARQTGWDGLLNEQRARLDDFWSGADIELEGDPEVEQAVRFALFHVFQAGYRSERRAIPAKGLTGPGYDGHAFWDTETFVLARPHLYPSGLGEGRAGMATVDARSSRGARPSAGFRGRGVPLANDLGARSAPRTGRPAPRRST